MEGIINLSLKYLENTMKTTDKQTKSYIELLIQFPPRFIHSEEELEAVQKVVYDIIDKGNLSQTKKNI